MFSNSITTSNFASFVFIQHPAMLDTDGSHHSQPNATAVGSSPQFPMDSDELRHPLLNLSKAHSQLDHVQRFLSDSLNTNTIIGESEMEIVSQTIAAAINEAIANGAALISCTGLQIPKSENAKLSLPSTNLNFNSKHSPELDMNLNNLKREVDLGLPKVEISGEEIENYWNIVELDAVQLLTERLHFCNLCGKGFKRDANLRMHMRAHGDKFKTMAALAKPENSVSSSSESTRGGRTRFSCPCTGCSHNKLHKRFRPLKSVICVKNHFKRSHCPKLYSCDRCHKKNFSVMADLKTHLKHCGETKWKCSCGTSFTRKEKLFRHIALFEGHMPAMPAEVKEVVPAAAVVEDAAVKEMDWVDNTMNDGFFDRFLEGLDSIDDDFCIQELVGCSNGGFDLNWCLINICQL